MTHREWLIDLRHLFDGCRVVIPVIDVSGKPRKWWQRFTIIWKTNVREQ